MTDRTRTYADYTDEEKGLAYEVWWQKIGKKEIEQKGEELLALINRHRAKRRLPPATGLQVKIEGNIIKF
jgi:hypothetical protein